MKITLSNDSLNKAAADLLAIGLRERKVGRDENFQRLDKAMGGALSQHVKDEDFGGKAGEVLKVPARGRINARWIVLVGLGSGAPAAADARVVAVRAAGTAQRHKSLAIVPPTTGADAVRAAAEGVVTGAYRYDTYFTQKPRGGLRSASILVADKSDEALVKAAADGQAIGESVNVARDLVNAPPNDMNPPALAEAAKTEAEKYGVKCTVWDKKRIQKEGMNLLLAVNAGSGVEPRFVHMAYVPPGPKEGRRRVVFVGKGITFDAGGLCIKPAKAMLEMKCDMAGAAVTIGIVLAAARLGLDVEVHGVVASTENLCGENAYRPSDVFTSYEGKTVEIINTDAEGRLVLADALAYAQKLEPDFIIDHATLTGACMVALGPWTAGLFTGHDEVASRYLAAADECGESYWRMPLSEDLREGLKSDVADIKHTGEPHGGAISAALFLREFVGKHPWAHMDIAGPAFLDRPHGLSPKGATGFGVATGVGFLRGLTTTAEPEA